jgi:hypothetical protein
MTLHLLLNVVELVHRRKWSRQGSRVPPQPRMLSGQAVGTPCSFQAALLPPKGRLLRRALVAAPAGPIDGHESLLEGWDHLAGSIAP